MSGSESWNEEQIKIQTDYSIDMDYSATQTVKAEMEMSASDLEKHSDALVDAILGSIIANDTSDHVDTTEYGSRQQYSPGDQNDPKETILTDTQYVDSAPAPQDAPSSDPDALESKSAAATVATAQPSTDDDSASERQLSDAPKPTKTRASSGNRKKRSRSRKADVPKPGTVVKKIDQSHLSPGTAESFKLLFTDIRTRHGEMLPEVGTSPKSWQKRQARIYSVNHTLNPIRYIIIILMAMCLAGRKYSWMTLGFMSGMPGMYVALMMCGLSLLINWQAVWKAVRCLMYMRMPFETLLLATTIVTTCEAYVNQNENTLLPIAVMSWCFAGLALDLHTGASLLSVNGLLSCSKPIGIRTIKEKWEGVDCIGKSRASTDGFIRHISEPDLMDSIFSIFGLPFLITVVLTGIYLSARYELDLLRVLSQLLLPGLPVSLLLSCARPYALMSVANKGRGMIAGWYGIVKLSGKKALMISDDDLFPEGKIICRGFRAFVRVTDSTLLSYAASLALEADIGFNEPFIQLMREASGSLMHVSGCVPEEGGARGVVHNDLVLIGSKGYMQLNGVTMPDQLGRYNVFIAVNGVLAGEFRMKYVEQKSARRILGTISQEAGLIPLLTAHNCYVNPQFIQKLFKVSISELICPKLSTRRELADKETMKHSDVCGYVSRSGIAAYGELVCRARRIYRTSLTMSMLTIILTVLFTVRAAISVARGTAMISGIQLVVIHVLLLLVLELAARFAARR